MTYHCHSIITLIMPAADVHLSPSIIGGTEQSRPRISQPLEYSGSLDSCTYSDLTPVIGTEYSGLQIVEILKDQSCDQIIKDFAVTSEQSPSILLAQRPSDKDTNMISSIKPGRRLPARSRHHPPANARIRRETHHNSRMRKSPLHHPPNTPVPSRAMYTG